MPRKRARSVTSPAAEIYENTVSYSDLVWYLRSERWQLTRKAALNVTRGRCQNCGRGTKRVVHRHYRTVGFEDMDDLKVECLACAHRSL